MNWGRLHLYRDDLDMLRARLKLLEGFLRQIIEIADRHEDPEEALIHIASLAEEALKL